MDDRYSKTEIFTHSGGKLEAVGVNNGKDIVKYINDFKPDANVIAVDEAFMIDGIADTLLSLFKKGKTIIVSSLQLSATGNIFEEIRDMMPWATKIEICPAVCPITGRDAYYTHRKIEGLSEITVGGSDLYEPRCWEFHSFMNERNIDGIS
jgi:thymidine kinase